MRATLSIIGAIFELLGIILVSFARPGPWRGAVRTMDTFAVAADREPCPASSLGSHEGWAADISQTFARFVPPALPPEERKPRLSGVFVRWAVLGSNQ